MFQVSLEVISSGSEAREWWKNGGVQQGRESDAPSPSSLGNSETAAPRRSTRNNGANQVDYKKFFQRGKAATVKTNSSIPVNSPHSEVSCILFDYVLNHVEQ